MTLLSQAPPPLTFEFLDVTTHRARKEHCCYRCQQPIQPGQRYFRTVYVTTDGKFHLEKSHCEAQECRTKKRKK